MIQLTRENLDILEFWFLKENPNATEEEIFEYLKQTPYSIKEIKNYLKSAERKESEFLKMIKKEPR